MARKTEGHEVVAFSTSDEESLRFCGLNFGDGPCLKRDAAAAYYRSTFGGNQRDFVKWRDLALGESAIGYIENRSRSRRIDSSKPG